MSTHRPLTLSVCIVLLNWNGWKDTIECLESVYRLQDVDLQVVVCDNDSHDGSLDHIEAWARGEELAPVQNAELASLTLPPVAKPVPVQRYESCEEAVQAPRPHRGTLILIQNGGNLGFAGGMNCGIRFSLAHGFDCTWLLNNDTVVLPETLSVLVHAMEQDSTLGIVGSQIRDYGAPNSVLVQGGKFYSVWSARVHANTVADGAIKLDYIDGAAILLRRSFLEQAGLMDERYFLYFEELDLARKASKLGFKQHFASESILFHKEGASAGTHVNPASRGLTAERFLARNRVLFTRRYHLWALPTVMAWILLVAIRAALHGDWKRAAVVLRAIIEGLGAA